MPVFARLVRANFLVLSEREFIAAARALGASEGQVIWRHLLPNAVSPLLVQATISFPNAMLTEVGLSYLGLGMQPPHPSWGYMLKEAQSFLRLAPTYAIFPGAAIALAVLGCNLLGDGLRDVLDPKLSRQRGEDRSDRAKGNLEPGRMPQPKWRAPIDFIATFQ